MLLDLLKRRCSVRNFLDKEISPEIISYMIEAARLSPSGGNEQPWEFGIITSDNLIQKISRLAYKQKWTLIVLTDGTGMTENGLIIDGKVTKLSEDLIFDYDSSDFMKPWTIKTAVTDRVDLILTPFFERIDSTNLMIVRSEVHQLIGHFSGTIKTDTGETITIENLPGSAEEHYGRW